MYANLYFAVEIDGIPFGGFSFVGGLESLIDTEGAEKPAAEARAGNIVLRRALDHHRELWEWHRANRVPGADRRDGTIDVLDDNGEPAVRIRFIGAWPCRWKLSPLDSLGGTVLLEEVELVVERFDVR